MDADEALDAELDAEEADLADDREEYDEGYIDYEADVDERTGKLLNHLLFCSRRNW